MSEITYNRGYWENKQLRYEHPYQEGKWHGIARWWYENGQLRYEYKYQEGKEHGVGRCWHKDGELQYEYHYLYGSRVTEEEYRRHELIEKLSGL